MKRIIFLKQISIYCIATLFLSISIISCNKNISNEIPIASSLDLQKFSNDSVLKSYLVDIKYLSDKASENYDTTIKIEEFEINFKKAFVEHNTVSKNLIAHYMGFEDVNLYWQMQNDIITKCRNLKSRFDLRSITQADIEKIIQNQKGNDFSLKPKVMSNDLIKTMDNGNGEECLERFKNCTDVATAEYATALFFCVLAAGPLAWNPIGPVVYLSCNAIAAYQVKTKDKMCATDLKFCNVK